MAEKKLQKNKTTKHQEDKKVKPINHEQEELIQWFRDVKFRKKLIGGVDEAHLWKKLEELNGLYDAAIRAERARYDALIREHTRSCNAVIRKYKQKNQEDFGSDPTKKALHISSKREVQR